MASRTTNYGLIKPDYDDTIDVAQLNSNSDIIDTQLNTKVKKSGDVMTGTLEVPNIIVNDWIYNKGNTSSVGISDNGNLNARIKGGLWFDRNYGTHQTYIGRTGDSAQLTLNDSEYDTNGQNGWAILHANNGTNEQRLTLQPSGTLGFTGYNIQGTNELIRLMSNHNNSYVECHDNGYTYVKANGMQCVSNTYFNVISPSGTTLSINDNGKAYLQNKEVETIYELSANYCKYTSGLATIDMEVSVSNANGWVNYPIPLVSTRCITLLHTFRDVGRTFSQFAVGANTNTGCNIYKPVESGSQPTALATIYLHIEGAWR